MSCRRSRRTLPEYLFDEMDRVERADFESHLDGCQRCRKQVHGLRRLWKSLPEPYPAALEPPPQVWAHCWERILERVTVPGADRSAAPAAGGLSRPARWTAAAAVLAGAFLLGLRWEDVRLQAMHLTGLAPAAEEGYFSGLESFASESDNYLQRSRLVLMELQQTGATAQSVDDPWLAEHSRLLLGEAPRHLTAARRIRNPRIEDLLAELESVLRQVLENGGGGAGLPPELEAETELLLFKLEMLDRTSPAVQPGRSAPL